MSKYNVVILNDFGYKNGGSSEIALNSIELLDKDMFNAILFCADGENKAFNTICLKQRDILNTPFFISVFQGLFNLKAFYKLISLLFKLGNKKTVVHVHGFTKALSPSIFLATFITNSKVVVTVHDYFLICPNGGLFDYVKQQHCVYTPLSNQCISCNCDSRNYYHKLWRLIRQFIQNTFVSLNKKNLSFIFVSKFSYKLYKSNNFVFKNKYMLPNFINIKKEGRVLAEKNDLYIFIGRLSKEKGVELFCSAVEQLQIQAEVLGDGYLKNELENRYKQISFLGWVTKDELISVLKRARALLFTSVCYETAGLAVLEALAYGIPCVVSDTCAASDSITNNINGLIFKSGNIKSLKKNILLLQDDCFVKQLSINAFKIYWKNNVSNHDYRTRLQNIYKKAIKSK